MLDFFSGGKANIGRQQELADIARRRLLAGMAEPEGPGVRELAAREAQREAMRRLASETAGMTGTDAAVAARRRAMLAPVLQQTAASQAMGAAAADEEARQAAIAQLFGQATGAAGQISAAEEAERQRRAQARQAAFGSIFDLGTSIAMA